MSKKIEYLYISFVALILSFLIIGCTSQNTFSNSSGLVDTSRSTTITESKTTCNTSSNEEVVVNSTAEASNIDTSKPEALQPTTQNPPSSLPNNLAKESSDKSEVNIPSGFTSQKCMCDGSWVVVKEPTVSSAGIKESVCSKCGDKKTEYIPKKPAVSGIDPAVTITIGKYTNHPKYVLGDCHVNDIRTWGEPPTITVFNENCMHVTYYNQNNEKVEFDVVPMPDMSEHILSFTLLENGQYGSRLWGAFT